MSYKARTPFRPIETVKILRRNGEAVFQAWKNDPALAAVPILKMLIAVTIVWGFWNLSRVHAPVISAGADASFDDEGGEKPESRSLEYYLAPIARKNLFRNLIAEVQAPKPVISKPVVPAAPPPPSLPELAVDLSLVGIINNGGLEAVIFNKKTQKTSYLREGQALGAIVILKVRDNGVTLGHNDETLNLNL